MQVTVKLPPNRRTEKEEDESVSGSGSPAEPEEGDKSDAKSINIDEPTPTSYICLGYIFSIIAGFCFTSWQVANNK